MERPGCGTDDRIQSKIHALWDEIPRFGAVHVESGLHYLLIELAKLVGAQRAYWLGGVRLGGENHADPVHCWRLQAYQRTWMTPMHDELFATHMQGFENGEADPFIAAHLEGAGRFRINRKHMLVSDEDYRTAHQKRLLDLNRCLDSHDLMYAALPLGEDAESWLCFERIGPTVECFSEVEQGILMYAVRPLTWFQQQVMLFHGVKLAGQSLLPSERRVLTALLTDSSEQEIADMLGLAPSTVHTYSTRLCRKFNVRGRTGLMALWLGNFPEFDTSASVVKPREAILSDEKRPSYRQENA